MSVCVSEWLVVAIFILRRIFFLCGAARAVMASPQREERIYARNATRGVMATHQSSRKKKTLQENSILRVHTHTQLMRRRRRQTRIKVFLRWRILSPRLMFFSRAFTNAYINKFSYFMRIPSHYIRIRF